MSVAKMTPDNPFYTVGYRWEWRCPKCKAWGGCETRSDAKLADKQHECSPPNKQETER